MESSAINDDVITCRFWREKTTVVQGREFDLVNTPYNLLVAAGKGLKSTFHFATPPSYKCCILLHLPESFNKSFHLNFTKSRTILSVVILKERLRERLSKFLGNGVGFHDTAFDATGDAKLLADVGGFTTASNILIRVHGALMLASWIGTASIGILLARYYKQTWVSSQLCGKDHWFAVSIQFFS